MTVRVDETGIPGTYRLVPEKISDERGHFYEAAKYSELTGATGLPFTVRQVNNSVSRRGVLRGVHCNDVPGDASKLVTCVRGAILDVMVDLRVGSPTFGAHEATRLQAGDGVALYMPGSIGHAFLALEEGTCVNYLLSTEYVPGAMVDLDALDPALDLPWALDGPPVRSAKDAAAPTLAEAMASGRLPHYTPPTALDLPRPPDGPPVRPAKDAAAPTLAEAMATGRLPHYTPPTALDLPRPPNGPPMRPAKDAAAPTLAEAMATGRLPHYTPPTALDLPRTLDGPPMHSAKDAAAPTLAEVTASGRLLRYPPSRGAESS